VTRRNTSWNCRKLSTGSLEQVSDVEPQEAELEAARSSLATGTVARSGVYPNLASRFDFWPVETAEGQNAVIGLAFDPDERPSAPDALIIRVVRVLALVLDRQHIRQQTHGSGPISLLRTATDNLRRTRGQKRPVLEQGVWDL
jgi:hypothetical protein